MDDLKVQALLQRMGQIVVEAENRSADYRVQITNLTNENNQLKEELVALQAPEPPDAQE